MCVVSMVVGGWGTPGSNNYFNFSEWQNNPLGPSVSRDMLEVLKKLEELDKKMGLKECAVEEKEKDSFKKRLQKLADKKKR